MKTISLALLVIFGAVAQADTYALVIGSPPFAPEAQKIAVYLRQKSDSHVKGILKEKATHKKVIEGFDWLKKSVKKGDIALIYISAHGSNTPYYHFSTKDQAVSGKVIKEAIEPLQGKTLIIVDTCAAGGILRQKWGDKVAIICASKEDEVSWTGLLGPATLNALQRNTGVEGIKSSIHSYITLHRRKDYWQTPQYYLPKSMGYTPIIRRK